MIEICKREFKKLLKHPSVFWVLFFLIVFIGYCYISVGDQFQNSYNLFLEKSGYTEQQIKDYIANSAITEPMPAQLNIISSSMVITYVLAIINTLGPMGLSILGALIFGIEYRHSTMRQLWISGMSKSKVIAGKLISLSVIICVYIGICILTAYVMSILTPMFYHLPMNLISTSKTSPTFFMLLMQITGTFLSLLLWGVFAACVTVVCKSLLTGVVVGFLYPIIESIFLHSWSFGQWFPLFIQKSMLPFLFEETTHGGMVTFYKLSDYYSLNQSLFLTFLYIIFFVFITYIGVKKQVHSL